MFPPWVRSSRALAASCGRVHSSVSVNRCMVIVLSQLRCPYRRSDISGDSQRPNDLEHHALLKLHRVRVTEDDERLRSAVAGMAVGEVAVGAGGLRDQAAADPLP